MSYMLLWQPLECLQFYITMYCVFSIHKYKLMRTMIDEIPDETV